MFSDQFWAIAHMICRIIFLIFVGNAEKIRRKSLENRIEKMLNNYKVQLILAYLSDEKRKMNQIFQECLERTA